VVGISELDPAYSDPDEINAFLDQIQRNYPDWVQVDSIGHSSEYGLPIRMAKLSDHPDLTESEPAILFIGQVHAEEVIGVEIVLELIRLLLENAAEEPYRSRLEGLELYFIPTANPEGLAIVHSDDVTFRKNCRDNIGDGRFRFHTGAGWDTSGVDLNRNFGLQWDRGDTLFHYSDPPYVYNYYCGPTPFSEPETQALRDIALAHRFLFSANYHSSRSGRDAELVIGPWSWDGRTPPDNAAISALGDEIADRIPTADGASTYVFGRSTQRVGQSQDWFYQAAGTFQYLIEVGTDVQPDSAGLWRIVQDNLPAAFYLMDLALAADTLLDYGLLTVTAADRQTGSPVAAIITLNGSTDPVLEPLQTSALNGRLDRLLPDGNYLVDVHAPGYTATQDSIAIAYGTRQQLDFALEPLPVYSCRLQTRNAATGRAIAARFRLSDEFGVALDALLPANYVDEELYAGHYSVKITADSLLPYLGDIDVAEESDFTFNLTPAAVANREDFDNDAGWQRGGSGEAWGMETIENRTCLSDSPNDPYARSADAWLIVNTGLEMDSAYGVVLEIVHRPYFEPGRDFGLVEVYQNRDARFDTLAKFSHFNTGWDTTFVSLSGVQPGSLKIRFRIFSDNRVEEDGWLIDQMTIYRTTDPFAVSLESPVPGKFLLTVQPNPANGMVLVRLELASAVSNPLALYDATGRYLMTLHAAPIPAGSHLFSLDGSRIPSGIYYLRLQSASNPISHQLTILR
jgi:hypothetical protein